LKSSLNIFHITQKNYVHLFFGGGSLEIYCAQIGIRIYGYDNFKPLADFWQWLFKDPNKLADAVKKYWPLKTKDEFYNLQKEHINAKNPFERAVQFYVLNRTSYSGSTLLGGMASYQGDINPRFTISSIERIRNFKIKNLTVEFADFKDSIQKHPNTLLYLDPPYQIESKLYGKRGEHKNFDHKALASILKNRKKWILSYNNSEQIQEMYGEFQLLEKDWTYGMNKDKKSNELLILSNDLHH